MVVGEKGLILSLWAGWLMGSLTNWLLTSCDPYGLHSLWEGQISVSKVGLRNVYLENKSVQIVVLWGLGHLVAFN